MFFENKVLYGTKGEVPEGDEGIPLGVADIKREGDDVTIVAISRMVQQALAAADALSAEGIEAEVIDPRTLSPLDDETILNSVAKTHRLVVVDEDNPRCSVATDIAAMVADKGFDTLDAPIKRRHRAAHAGAVQPAAGAVLRAKPGAHRGGGAGDRLSRYDPVTV